MAPASRPPARPIIAFVFRILQIVFCLMCLGASAHWANTWRPFRLGTFQVWAMLQSVNLAIFASVTGLLMSAFLLFAPRIAPKVADDLPGLVDLILSSIWSIFFLSAAGSLASWGKCKANSLCAAWNVTIGVCFLLWVLYAVTAVLAGLDLKAQIDALKGTPAPAPAPAPVKKVVKPAVRKHAGVIADARKIKELVHEFRHAKGKKRKLLKARVMKLKQDIVNDFDKVTAFGHRAKTAFARAEAKEKAKVDAAGGGHRHRHHRRHRDRDDEDDEDEDD